MSRPSKQLGRLRRAGHRPAARSPDVLLCCRARRLREPSAREAPWRSLRQRKPDHAETDQHQHEEPRPARPGAPRGCGGHRRRVGRADHESLGRGHPGRGPCGGRGDDRNARRGRMVSITRSIGSTHTGRHRHTRLATRSPASRELRSPSRSVMHRCPRYHGSMPRPCSVAALLAQPSRGVPVAPAAKFRRTRYAPRAIP